MRHAHPADPSTESNEGQREKRKVSSDAARGRRGQLSGFLRWVAATVHEDQVQAGGCRDRPVHGAWLLIEDHLVKLLAQLGAHHEAEAAPVWPGRAVAVALRTLRKFDRVVTDLLLWRNGRGKRRGQRCASSMARAWPTNQGGPLRQRPYPRPARAFSPSTFSSGRSPPGAAACTCQAPGLCAKCPPRADPGMGQEHEQLVRAVQLWQWLVVDAEAARAWVRGCVGVNVSWTLLLGGGRSAPASA